MQGIKVSVNYVGARLDVVLLTITGYVDTTTCLDLTKQIQSLMKQKRYQIIADLGEVSYISSAGWGVFVGEIKNIREKGGDIKIVQMTPEVFEVFEMLEFNRILNYYDSIEEAIDEFDIIRGINITKPEERKGVPQISAKKHVRYPGSPVASTGQTGISEDTGRKEKLPVKDYPLVEKIKLIVVENPIWGIRSIQKQLRLEKYGNAKINLLKLHSLLKKLNLETKVKRYRFYRSR